MAESKATAVSFPAFSTIRSARRIDRFILNVAVLDRTKQDAQFTPTQGSSGRRWVAALLLHLHGDLQ